MQRSPIRRAEAARDARAQVGFRGGRGDVHAAVDQSIDERPDDFGAVQHLAALAADLDGKTIEVVNLAVEEDHRHFRPGFIVNWRASRTRFWLWPRRRSH